MSFFVVVTFDLKYASTSKHGLAVYKKLYAAFEQIDFSKHITGRKKVRRTLPANTLVAEFEVSEDFAHSKALVSYVTKEMRSIFKAYSIRSHYFVSAGQRWAWGTGRVQ